MRPDIDLDIAILVSSANECINFTKKHIPEHESIASIEEMLEKISRLKCAYDEGLEGSEVLPEIVERAKLEFLGLEVEMLTRFDWGGE